MFNCVKANGMLNHELHARGGGLTFNAGMSIRIVYWVKSDVPDQPNPVPLHDPDEPSSSVITTAGDVAAK